MLTFKNYNIADWISFYRIAAAPILLLLLFLNERNIFTWFLLISYCTDAIDGFVARKLKITSARGSQLDSFGDQITFILGLIAILIFEFNFIKENYILIIVSFSPYIIQMIIAFIKYGKATAFHTYLAKLSAIVQSIFILWLLFFEPIYWLFYVMIVLGILETIEEVTLIFMYDNWVSGVKGIYWAFKDKRRK
ncbi:CDP-diacylglycerol--glycerol-3-phosphate 3-phosphatidyltransferase [Lutibacter oceani]|uniref:CDP-diacylglycerol--glycerol-3-phosphate 3-phosphatidyltransferase n=1 Tax=Lutibacter oceani TaxID=1853311 RepID=A0A3D9RP81_9FLAO|nr:CDP-alcohol phosphatidyltransferase family protein [Lutibacter oceani]REE81617.1 CDP-diacylglycerol--glycerol-3-phosphate 3-phosphatidyltransferase [Lutibacter oceani]